LTKKRIKMQLRLLMLFAALLALVAIAKNVQPKREQLKRPPTINLTPRNLLKE
jgi:hypothetical protein